METEERQLNIDEAKIVAPLMEIINDVPSNSKSKESVQEALASLFPEQQYDDKRIKSAKHILGSITNELTQQQLLDIVSEISFLVESWLDDFEREIFNGLTLRELLHEKGAG